jgi:arsenate reductase
LLKEHGADYEYREYTEAPLSQAELKALFKKLKLKPAELLRKKEAKAAGLTGDESDARLIKAMADEPTLLQRPIAVKGARAVLGRPVENLEALL